MSSRRSPHSRPDLVALGGAAAPRWLTPEAIGAVLEAEDLPFSESEYESRLESVRHRMADLSADALVVFRPSSVEYLCGFHTMETTPQPLLVTRSETFLFVPDLEVGRALAGSRVGNVVYWSYADVRRGPASVLEHAAGLLPHQARLAIEVGHPSTPPQAVEALERTHVELVHGDYLVENVRLVLSPAELDCVEQAAHATEAGVAAAVEEARRPGATDSSVAAAVTAALFERANAASAWGPVVATGRRGGIAHSTWCHRPMADGVTFVEFAGAHHRYHAPVMRTLCRGRPSAQVRMLATLAETALSAVLGRARAGVSCAEVARAGHEALGPLPDDVVFHHVFGYPVGLAHPPHWMDGAPFYITADNDEPLQEGMVFHMPGSFRSFGNAGVGLSQTFVVERDGARPLTHGAAELTVL